VRCLAGRPADPPAVLPPGESPPANPARQRREDSTVDIEEALYTTRAMRRVRPDPVPLEVQEKILDAAIRAPTGGNAQNWRFPRPTRASR
jgi:hypothetical protein